MTEKLQPVTFTDRIRAFTGAFMARLGAIVVRMGIHPDVITAVGLLIVAIGSVIIARGELQLGAIVLAIGLPLDAVDGAVARAMERKDRFGELLDSTLDRYADAFIFAGLGYYFAVQNRLDMLVLAFIGLIGTQVVSYVRARADGVGVSVKIGLFTRLERVTMIMIMLFVPDLLPLGLLILAIGTNFTGLQRLWFVYRTLRDREKVS
jgi:CDP-diacylglycerol---glycerol-3-phosphate 3-phosphatidyltransferase